jgi:hypothetical protein
MEGIGHSDESELAQLETSELRVIANFCRAICGANSFLAALAEAHRLSPNGELISAAIWNKIADKINRIEISAQHDGSSAANTPAIHGTLKA